MKANINSIKSLENSFNIYPNPVGDESTTIEFNLKESVENSTIYLTNIIGKRVQAIYSGALNADNYQFRVNTETLS